MQNIRLCDPSSTARNEVTVNLFDGNYGGLWGDLQKGDIVILHGVSVNRIPGYFGERPQAIGRATQGVWVALNRNTLAEYPCLRGFNLTERDWHIARLLKQWHGEQESQGAVSAEQGLRSGRPRLRTEDIKEGCAPFFDYACRVVANALQAHNRRVLLVTDFTVNAQPLRTFSTKSTIDFQYIMQVTLWDENAQAGADLQPESLVMLKNCVRKTSIKRAQEIAIRGDARQVRNAPRVVPISLESPEGRELIE